MNRPCAARTGTERSDSLFENFLEHSLILNLFSPLSFVARFM